MLRVLLADKQDLLDSTRLKPGAPDITHDVGGGGQTRPSVEEKNTRVSESTTPQSLAPTELGSNNGKEVDYTVDVASAEVLERHLKPRHM